MTAKPPTTISLLDSDDDEPPAARPPPRGSGTSKECAVELSDDDEPPTAPAAAAPKAPAPTSAAAGPSSSSVDLTNDDDDTGPNCGVCGRLPSARERYVLDECKHIFCEGCVRSHVSKKVSETLAHEIGCPKCGRQLSIGNVNELGKAAADPASKRPRSGPPPMPWGGGGPAAMLAALAGGGFPGAGGFPGGGMMGGGGRARKRVAGNPAATKRIMKELQAIQKSDSEAQGFEVSVPDESDVYTWQAEFFDFEKGSGLASDLKRVPGKRIVLSVAFPSSFPAQPPYVRVIRPRFAFRTGHVTIGGSICTEMLTSQGWMPTMTMESVLLGIRTNMLIGGARLDPHNHHDYTEIEAQIAFDRMVREHGWY